MIGGGCGVIDVTWNDVAIEVIGGKNAPYTWEVNNRVVIEDVLAALHLPPWAVGYSHPSTKNWVASQFDLMMTQADSIQRRGKRFAEWIRNTELAMAGIPARSELHFTRLRDPSRLASKRSESVEIANVLAKYRAGIIDIDTAAREMGYTGAADAERSRKWLDAASHNPQLAGLSTMKGDTAHEHTCTYAGTSVATNAAAK